MDDPTDQKPPTRRTKAYLADLTKRVPQTDIRVIAKAEKVRDCLILRKQGLDYEAIAEQMDIPVSMVQIYVREAIRAIPEEEAREIRAIETARLDDLLARCYRELAVYDAETELFDQSKGMEGRCHSAKVYVEIHENILHISQRRAKLLGLDAPVEVKGSSVSLVGIADLLAARDAEDNTVETDATCQPTRPPMLPTKRE